MMQFFQSLAAIEGIRQLERAGDVFFPKTNNIGSYEYEHRMLFFFKIRKSMRHGINVKKAHARLQKIIWEGFE